MRQVKHYSCAFTLLEMAFLIGWHKKFLWLVVLCELFQRIDGPRKKTHGLECAALEGYREGDGCDRALLSPQRYPCFLRKNEFLSSGNGAANEHLSRKAYVSEKKEISNEQDAYMGFIACWLLGPVLDPKLKIGF